MNSLMVVVSIVLALLVTGSALGKFRRSAQVIESLRRVGVKDAQIPVLGALEVAGGLGLVVGLAVQPLAVVAAIGLVVYFAGALLSHLRVKDPVAALAPAAFLLVLSVATLVLELNR